MSTQPSSQPSSDAAHTPQTMPGQSALNVVMRGLLSTPGVASGIGKRLITLHVIGRKSGKLFKIPVAYTEHEGLILVGTPFAWGRNLRTGEPLEVRFKGRKQTADVEVVTDETGVVALYDVMCRDNGQFAKFNKVSIDASGDPSPADLRAAWQGGARVFKLKLR